MQHGFIDVPLGEWGRDPSHQLHVHDLLSDEHYIWRGSRNYVRLDPGSRVAHILLVQLDEPLPPEPAMED